MAAVLTLFASAGHANEIITSSRCSNSYKGEGGKPPPTNNKLHAGVPGSAEALALCQLQCDTYSSFQQCDWFIYLTDGGEDEDCLLYGPEKMVMEEWLDGHNIKGQPVLGCPAPIDDEEKCVTPEKNQVDAGSLHHPYAPMNFAVSGCRTSSPSDIDVMNKGTYEECLEHKEPRNCDSPLSSRCDSV